MIKILLCLVTMLNLASCRMIDTRGQYIDEQAITELQANKPSKEKVMELIGTPTIVPDYTPDTWYYVQRTLARRAWLEPKIIEQRIVEIKFNSDIVDKVVVFDKIPDKEFQGTSEYTRTYGTEASGIQKFVRNIGRFNKKKGNKKSKNKP